MPSVSSVHEKMRQIKNNMNKPVITLIFLTSMKSIFIPPGFA